MLGTIEELEKDIEKFRANVAASDELKTLLDQILEQIKTETAEFERQSRQLLTNLDELPENVKHLNNESNAQVRKDISASLDKLLADLRQEQEAYITAINSVKQIIEAYTRQSETATLKFEEGTKSNLELVNALPERIEQRVEAANEKHTQDMDVALEKRNEEFSGEQAKYIQVINDGRHTIEHCVERTEASIARFEEGVKLSLEVADALPERVEQRVEAANEKHTQDMDTALEKRNEEFSREQEKYIHALESGRQIIERCVEQTEAAISRFEAETKVSLEKIAAIPDAVEKKVETANASQVKAIDEVLAKRNAEFSVIQASYISELQNVTKEIQGCESQLNTKYNEFIDTLEKMNVSNLYDQNVSLKKELDTRTMFLIVLSIISIILGIVGFFV